MRNCDEIVALLSEYLDRDLPPEACTAVETHLASCTRCGEEADALRRTVGLCREYRNENRPGPLPVDKHEEMIAVFRKALSSMSAEKGDVGKRS